jgi:hypothetical protein
MSMIQSIKKVFLERGNAESLVTVYTNDDAEIEGQIVNIDENFVMLNIQFSTTIPDDEKLILLNIKEIKYIALNL